MTGQAKIQWLVQDRNIVNKREVGEGNLKHLGMVPWIVCGGCRRSATPNVVGLIVRIAQHYE